MIHKRSTSLERSVKNILLEGLNRFNSAPTSPLVQMWIKTHWCLVCMTQTNKTKYEDLYTFKKGFIDTYYTEGL